MTREERASCIITIKLLRKLALNVHGVIDVIDNQNCDKIIEMLNNPEQHWIPCSSRLPDESEDVLLQFADNMGVGFYENGSWGINTGDGIYSEIGMREQKTDRMATLARSVER
jgi:hypothetical protein